ncbi:microsomal glutathione S-transferase 1-like [Aphomia sociella]
MTSLTLDNPLVQSYILYSAILAIKLLLVSVITAIARVTRNVFANPEDAVVTKGKVKYDDPVVERVRRAHLNDLENIPAFWLLGALYVTTGPAVAWAQLLFRVYALGRIIHTIVYAIIPLPQPARGISFGIPFLITIYFGVQVVLYYLTAL